MNILAFRRDGATLAACNISNGCFPSSWTPKGTPDPHAASPCPLILGRRDVLFSVNGLGLECNPGAVGGEGAARAGLE